MFRRPLFFPMVAWILGILLAQVAGPLGLPLGVLLAGAGATGVAFLTDRRRSDLSLIVLLAGLGLLRTFQLAQTPRYDLSRLLDPPAPQTESGGRKVEITVVGRLAADPSPYPNRLSFPLRVESASLKERTLPARGTVWVNLYPDRRRAEPASDPYPERLTYGERVQLAGTLRLPPVARNPGDFDYRAYLARGGIHGILGVRAPEGVRWGDVPGFSWAGFCLAAKRRMEAGLAATLPRAHADLLSGLLFSERRQLPPALIEAFTVTGTVHLLSTSGIHVAVLAGALNLLFGRSRRRFRKPLALLFVLLLVAFGVMAGMRPAVARAVLMAGLVYAADLVDRDSDAPNLLCLAALLLLILNPLDLFDMGFQF